MVFQQIANDLDCTNLVFRACRGVIYHVPNRKEYIRICFCGTEYELLNLRKNSPLSAVRNGIRVVELVKNSTPTLLLGTE